MANKTIPQLPEQTGKTDNDLLAIVDSGETTTSKIKVSTLIGSKVDTLEGLSGDLVLSGGTNITITDNTTDTITISASGGGSSLVVDGSGTESIKTNSTGNVAANNYSVVLGGQGNNIVGATTNFGGNGIIAGENNTINQRNDWCAIVGGRTNTIQNSFAYDYNFVGGGTSNNCGGSRAFSIGGNGNSVVGDYSGNLGGQGNTWNYWDTNVVIASDNGVVNNPSSNGVIVGGKTNTIGHNNSVVIGGSSQSTTRDNEVVVPNLTITNYASLNFANDSAAATAGIPLGGIYHTSGALKVRIT